MLKGVKKIAYCITRAIHLMISKRSIFLNTAKINMKGVFGNVQKKLNTISSVTQYSHS